MRLKTSKLKRAVAVLAATCTLGTCCVAGSIAWAAGPESTPVQGENTANIKSGQATSITIYKYEGPETSISNNGKEQTIPSTQLPISGVKFKLTPILDSKGNKIDLSQTSGWEAIKNLNVENKTAAQALKDANLKLSTTAADIKEQATCAKNDQGCTKEGSTTFDLGTTYGLYLVEEDLANSKPMRDGKPVSVTKQVNPFLVTVPLPNTKDHDWIYKLNIYPKNDVSTNRVTKKAQAAPNQPFIDGTKTTMGWDISIPLTALKPGETKYSNVSFTDPINTDFLNYSSVKDVKLTDKDGNNAEPLDTSMYEVKAYSDTNATPTEVTDLSTADKLKTVKWIRVKLIGEGLTKATAKVGGKLIATVVTTVIAPGQIKNFINTDVDGITTGEGDKTPCVPTKDHPCETPGNPTHEGEDTTNFATLNIDKIGLSDGDNKDGKPLKGAVFQVYEAAEGKQLNDLNGKKVSEVNTANAKGLIDDSGKVRTMAATNDKGKASDSFFVGNNSTTSHVYCAVETKAPDGFELDDKLHCVNLTAGAEDSANTLKINNKKSTAVDKILGALPMTGARGLVVLTVCGIVGIAGTLFYVVMKRRKEQEQE